jgi:hypothetical protein
LEGAALVVKREVDAAPRNVLDDGSLDFMLTAMHVRNSLPETLFWLSDPKNDLAHPLCSGRNAINPPILN